MVSVQQDTQVSVEQDVESFGHMIQSDIAGTHGRLICSLLSILYPDFQSACASLQFHQQRIRVPFSPTTLSVILLLFAILTGVKWKSKVVLTYISLITRDGEHFLRYFLARFLLFLINSIKNTVSRSQDNYFKWVILGVFGVFCFNSIFKFLIYYRN